MFFVHEMEERIPLHPSYFSSEAPDSIRELLYKKKEGTNTGTMMIVRIIGIQEISEPKVMPGTGMAMYTISYRAVVWQPFRGEVVDGEVSQVVPNGFFVDVGALGVFVSKAVSYWDEKYIPADRRRGRCLLLGNGKLTGVLWRLQMIPSSMKFSMEGATPSFEDSDGQLIAAGVHIRLRIKGIRSELNQMFAIGSIREDYLGYEPALTEQITSITDTLLSVLSCRNIEIAHHNPFLSSCLTRAVRRFFFFHPCNSGVLHSGLQRGVGDMGREQARREKHTMARNVMFTFFMSSNEIPNRNRKLFVQSSQLSTHPAKSRFQHRPSINQWINNRPSPTKAGKPPNASQKPHQPP
jgi:DNA-directed RNA polymerase II subunit RPB7